MRKTTLPNGLDLIVEENHAARVAAMQVWVKVGSADEQASEYGLAHVHEHMLFKGTARRGVGEIAATIEAAGGDINAWTSYDQTVYHVTMASRDFPVGLDILADAVQSSAFQPEELTKELEVVVEEIRRGRDTPSRVASENLFSTAFNVHPYSRPVIGTVESVRSFTRDGILAFYRRWYRPKNMCLVVVGDVDAEDVLKRAEGLFSADSGAELPVRPRPSEPLQAGFRGVIESAEIQETHLALAFKGTAFRHVDTPALDVLSILLGGGESSRLVKRIKREQELVNDCYASAYTPQDPGLLFVGANIHGEGVNEAYRALLMETLRLRHELVRPAEIEKARTIILSDAVFQKETVQGVARKLGWFELIAGDSSYEEQYYAAVRRVTPDDVRRVAQTYLRVDALSLSCLLPKSCENLIKVDSAEALARSVEADLEKEAQRRGRFSAGGEGVAVATLENGARLLVKEDPSLPLVAVRTASVGGLLAETPATNGVTYLLGELLLRGTKQYSADQISDLLDSTASAISGLSGRNSIGLSAVFLKEFWDRGFDLFTSVLLEPTFDEEELEKERKIQLEDINSRQDSLSTLAFDLLAESLWREHPYRRPVIGTKESVSALTREQVEQAFEQQLRPDKLCIAVVGAVDVADTVRLFDRRVGAFRPSPNVRPLPERPLEPPPTEPRSAKIVKKKEQAHLALGFPGVRMSDPARWPLEVLSTALAGQGGRLFYELRDKQSLAYSVTAFTLEGLDPGYFAVYIGTAQEKLETAERGLRAELERVLDQGLTAEELARAKRYLIGSHEVALQRSSARAGTMALNDAYGLGYDEYAKYASRIDRVTLDDVREVGRQIIRFDRLVRSVVSAS